MSLSEAFGAPFEKWISSFVTAQELMGLPEEINSPRFLSRSVVPHIEKLSSLFNREEKVVSSGLDPYWKTGSHLANLRLAYFLYFMPCNLYRVSAIWSELARLGFRWPEKLQTLRAIEIGAGPASGACGIAAGEMFSPVGLPEQGNWALIEQDKAMLHLGADWTQEFFQRFPGAQKHFPNWGTRTFHRKVEIQSLLPKTAPKFNLWVMSYFLNEFDLPPKEIAQNLIECWKNHLEEEGIVILVEPALKLQSRRLLELRKALLEEAIPWLQVLLPCLGHQSCGAPPKPKIGATRKQRGGAPLH